MLVGKQYQIQLFDFDNRPIGTPLVGTEIIGFSDGLGNNSATFAKGSATSIIGRFVADTTSQNIILLDDDDHTLNAYVLRMVPEPESIAMEVLGGIILIMGFRSREQRKTDTNAALEKFDFSASAAYPNQTAEAPLSLLKFGEAHPCATGSAHA